MGTGGWQIDVGTNSLVGLGVGGIDGGATHQAIELLCLGGGLGRFLYMP